MAEAESLKRQRQEKTHFIEEEEDRLELDTRPSPDPYPKRHKSYTHILSILDDDGEDDEEEETEPIFHDFSSIFTSLQQELSSESVAYPTCNHVRETDPTQEGPVTRPASHGEDDEKVMLRHLLEATDDELGLPQITDGCDDESDGMEAINGGDAFGFGDGSFWELEDETANYYTLLQSELFM